MLFIPKEEILTFDHAYRAASILRRDGRICGIELFGSVAREGSGRDLDLILLVQNRALANEFMALTKELANAEAHSRSNSDKHDYRSYYYTDREKVATTVLGLPFADLWDQAIQVLPLANDPFFRRIHPYILSRSWKDEVKYLKQGFPQGDPNFWENVKRDAIMLSR